VLSDDSSENIQQTRSRWPGKSLRKLSRSIGLCYGIVHGATKVMKFNPYCIYVMIELEEPDKEKRRQYIRQFTHCIRGGIDT
jgi:hypothetical protein